MITMLAGELAHERQRALLAEAERARRIRRIGASRRGTRKRVVDL